VRKSALNFIDIFFLQRTSMPLFRAQARVAVCAFASLLGGATTFLSQNTSAQNDMDRSIKPGDDFYRYANGGWLKTVAMPAGRTSYDTRAILTEKTARQVSDLIQSAAAANAAKGSVTQKVGDFYAGFMDEAAIEVKGFSPLAEEMAKISAITNKTSLSGYLGATLNSEVDGLTANSDHVFGVWINQGFQDAQHNLPHIWQGGLGMPDRDSYLDSSPKVADLRARYQAHIAAILKLAGIADSEAKAANILSLEIKIAQSHAPDADAADVAKQNNPWKRADFSTKAPGMDWAVYFASAGLTGQEDFIVWQPSAVTGTSVLVESEGVGVWRDYLSFHLIEHYASVLPRSIADEDFSFYGKVLSVTQPPTERSAAAITATNAALGQAVGQLYTQRYFPPEAKAQAHAMGANLLTAFRGRISNLTWMTPQTKQKALAKLAAFKLGLGYPDVWIDYSTLNVVRGDAVGNMRRAEAFNRARNLAQLKRPVDPIEWPINAQIPGAIIMFSPNAEFFSAAILQPPFFDYQGDAATNYGSAGAGMAHEISHSFDELGNIYDDQGRLANWWTAEDLASYRAASATLAAEFDGYCPLPGVCVNGKKVLGENIADLAGLLVAHDAYILSLKGKPDVEMGGLSGEQRFFLAFSQRWRKLQDEAALRRQIATDTHAPGEYRSDTVRNIEAWYKAFGIASNDKLYLKPEDRARIW
jgi:predicted metalloendopeptidase